VEFLLNEKSLHGQFASIEQFRQSLKVLMAIREEVRKGGRQIFCHRQILNVCVFGKVGMQEAVGGLLEAERRAWLQWITRQGPHWDDNRQHSGDDWWEVCGEICTDTAVGESAFCTARGERRDLVSVSPSDWLVDPLNVTRVMAAGEHVPVDVRNHWTVKQISQALNETRAPIKSWRALESHVRRAYPNLLIADNAFEGLDGLSFSPPVAEQLRRQLEVLDEIKQTLHADGTTDKRFHEIHETVFRGDNAWFSDESDTRKQKYARQFTFPHPQRLGETLFCTWHGKPNCPRNFLPIRFHFSWPVRFDTPLYVVYVGVKIEPD
jgi:hypothetical protein